MLLVLLSIPLVFALTTDQFIQQHNLQQSVFPSTHASLIPSNAKGAVQMRPIQYGDFFQYSLTSDFVWSDAYLLDDNFGVVQSFSLQGNKIPMTSWIQKTAHTQIADTNKLKQEDYHFLYYACNIRPLNLAVWTTLGPFDCKWELNTFSLKQGGMVAQPITTKTNYGLSNPNNLGPKSNSNIPCVTPNDGDKIDQDTTLCPGTYYFKTGLQIIKGGITLDCNGAILDGDDNGKKSLKSIWTKTSGSYSWGGSYCDQPDMFEKVIIKNCYLKNYENAITACLTKSNLENNKLEKNLNGMTVKNVITIQQSQGQTWYNWQLNEQNNYKNNIFTKNDRGLTSEYSSSDLYENNLFSGNNVGLNSDTSESTINNNKFDDNTQVGFDDCCWKNFVENNDFINNGASYRVGGSSGNSDSGLFIGGSAQVISQNHFSDNSRGIVVAGYGSGHNINDNIIENSKGAGIVYHSTQPFGSKPSLIKNNLIQNNPYGAYLEDRSGSITPQRITVTNNDFVDNKVQVYSDFVNLIDKNYYSDYSPTCRNINPADNYCDIQRPVDGGATQDLKPLAVTALSLAKPSGQQPKGCVTPTNGMQINQTTELCPGYYNQMDKGLEITNDGVVLDCKGATLNGLIKQTSQQGKITYIVGNWGVHWYGLNNVEIKNCNLEFYGVGISAGSSDGNLIHDNDITMTGNGIYSQGLSTEINNNRITSSFTGIGLENSKDHQIHENFLMLNTIGIWLYSSPSNVIFDNTILYSQYSAPVTTDSYPGYNTDGIAILLQKNSNSNEVNENLMDHNKIGVWVSNSNENSVYYNQIRNNVGTGKPHLDGIGIYVEADGQDVEHNVFTYNTIENSAQAGVAVYSYSGGGTPQFNEFNHNNFVKNSIHAVDPFDDNEWDDGNLGNYWDDHQGIICDDSDRDGICNNPRKIDPLPAVNQDNYPSVNPI